MDPKFVYFDLDDTLLNHKQAQRKALNDVHDYFSLFSDIETDWMVEVYHKINGEQWELYNEGKIDGSQLQHNRFALTLEKLGLDENSADEIGEQYLQFYQNYWQWVDGAEEAFKAISDKYKVGILTNGFTELQQKKFEQFDLYNQANELIISEEVGALKPDPVIFEYATNLAGCKPEEIFYIGDSFHSDVTGGHNFGWKVAWFTNNEDSKKQQKADFVFNDYEELMSLLQVEY